MHDGSGAPPLPPGRRIELAGRGTTFVREIEGPEGSPTLFLLHGLGASAELNWFTSFDALGRQFSVIAIDHRGHGRGIRSRRHFRLSDCADDAAAVAREVGIERFIAVGYSMGGPIAQLLWHRHRDLVEGLVLCATSRDFRGRTQERAGFAALAGLTSVLRVVPEPALRAAAGRVVPAPPEIHDSSEHPLAAWGRRELRRGDPRMFFEAARMLGRFSSREWIGEVDVPTAVVVTRDDQFVPPRRQQKLAAAIPGASLHEVAGDHLVVGMNPKAFVPVLLDACRTVAARAGYAVSTTVS